MWASEATGYQPNRADLPAVVALAAVVAAAGHRSAVAVAALWRHLRESLCDSPCPPRRPADFDSSLSPSMAVERDRSESPVRASWLGRTLPRPDGSKNSNRTHTSNPAIGGRWPLPDCTSVL